MTRRRSARLRIGDIPSNQMDILENLELLGPEKIAKLDVYQDLIRSKNEYNRELCEFQEKLLSKNNEPDVGHNAFFLSLLSISKRLEPHKTQKGKDDNAPDNGSRENVVGRSESYSCRSTSDEDIDPLRDYCSDEDCACQDEDSGCRDEEHRCESKKKLRSSTKQQKDGASNSIKCSTKVKSRNKVTSEKLENLKVSTSAKVPDPDYRFFLEHCKYVDGYHVFSYGTDMVVYGKSNRDYIDDNKETKDDDAYSDDVEIIDSITFYDERSLSSSKMDNEKGRSSIMESGFRRKVIDILRRPFDLEEYDKLRIEAGQHKPELRHRELRDGKEKSVSTNIDGKSYLDHYPDLGRKLLLCQADEPKCLNLLRGFFFWLQNIQQDGSFQPWNDEECLAIKPQSC